MKSSALKPKMKSRAKTKFKSKAKSAPGRITYKTNSFVLLKSPSENWNVVPNSNYINACMQKNEIEKMFRNKEIQNMKTWKVKNPRGKMKSYLVFKGNMKRNTNNVNKVGRPLTLYKELWNMAY